MQNAHALTTDEALSILQSNKDTGLSFQDARERLSEYGRNELTEKKRTSALKILSAQFSNSLIAILLVATVLSGYLGELVDALVILIIVALVAAVGFAQEYRTERVLDALKRMQTHNANVVREGEVLEVPVGEIVPGDIVVVAAGDKVAADMRVIESFSLRVNEASLTGESLPVEKTVLPLAAETPISDQINMLFSGTSVTDGKGRAVTVSTGMQTELGKIANQVIKEMPKASIGLERRMNEIGSRIGVIVLIIVSAITLFSLAEQYALNRVLTLDSIFALLLFGVALAVAAIPEALPAIMVGSLAIGAHSMAKENALARNLSAVETLGSTQVVCTDKTGTLTKGEMTVTELYASGRSYIVSGLGYEPIGEVKAIDGIPNSPDVLRELSIAMVLCNDATLVKEEENNRWTIKGDPTEGALVVLAQKLGLSQREMKLSFPRVWEIPFSSEKKRMTTLHIGNSNGQIVAYMKGSVESVLEKCAYCLEEGGPKTLDSFARDRIYKTAESMASKALRVLAIARRKMEKIASESYEADSIEREFEFLGLVGMIDPPRREAIEAVKIAKRIGINSVMITGDHRTTALAIARQMGIYKEGDLVLTGEELQRKSDSEFEKIVEQVTVYARVTPIDKLRIVEAWQKREKIVAMTGDGVNDAPALKRADIGIAMGITGTEVAKDAADMILLDDNFATIMKAVKLGRWIQDNVKKYLVYLLSGNLVEIAVLSAGVFLVSFFITSNVAEPLVPLLAVQILYINLATDGLPAFAVGIGPLDPDIMERQVQKNKEPTVFTPEVKKFILFILAGVTPVLLLVYLSGLQIGIDEARTRLFLAFVFVELAIAINCNSLRFGILRLRPHRWLVMSVLWETFLIVVLLWIPQARTALHLVTPSSTDILWTALATSFAFVYVALLKWLNQRTAV